MVFPPLDVQGGILVSTKAAHVGSTDRNRYCPLFPNFPSWTLQSAAQWSNAICERRRIVGGMSRILRSASTLAASWQCPLAASVAHQLPLPPTLPPLLSFSIAAGTVAVIVVAVRHHCHCRCCYHRCRPSPLLLPLPLPLPPLPRFLPPPLLVDCCLCVATILLIAATAAAATAVIVVVNVVAAVTIVVPVIVVVVSSGIHLMGTIVGRAASFPLHRPPRPPSCRMMTTHATLTVPPFLSRQMPREH